MRYMSATSQARINGVLGQTSMYETFLSVAKFRGVKQLSGSMSVSRMVGSQFDSIHSGHQRVLHDL
jgi:hypothetical protein